MCDVNKDSEKLDEAYEKFISCKETDEDIVPEPEIDGKASKMDKFICVVNKPIFFLFFMINVAFMLYAVSFSNLSTLLVYVGCLFEMILTNSVLFIVCYKLKLKRGTLKVHKIKFWKKALLIGGAILLGLLVSIGLAFYQVNRYAGQIDNFIQPKSINTNESDSSEVSEDDSDTAAKLAGAEKESQ